MGPQLVQRTRYVLRSRVRRAETCPIALFPSACKQLVEWLSNHPIFSALIRQLESRTLTDVEQVRALSNSSSTRGGPTRASLGQYTASTTEEHAEVCWAITRTVSEIAADNF